MSDACGMMRDGGSTRIPPSSMPLSRPDIGEVERRSVDEAIRSGWISGTGPYLAKFEEALAQQVQRRHVIATANGTLALEVALRAMGVGYGDEVIVPAFTFAAPALCVLAVGATPVIADIDESTWTLDVGDAERKRTSRTRAVIAVDVLGHPCDFDALDRLGIPVIEDAAEAHGAQYRGEPAGSFGLISVFSFHANKPVSTGEGGCVGTDSGELAERVRCIVNHGMVADEPYLHRVVGRNFRMTNLTAAIGFVQVERWDELTSKRNEIARRYDELLGDLPGYRSRPKAEWAHYSCWLHTVVLPDRTSLITHLRACGVDARPVWPALTEQPVLQEYPAYCPVAERIAQQAIFLPTSSLMSAEDVDMVCSAIKSHIATRSKKW